MLKICILDAQTLGKDIEYSMFNDFGEVTVFENTSKVLAKERLKGYDIVLTNKVVLDSYSLEGADKLKLICVLATGTNNIDLDYCKSKGIAVTNVAGYSTMSVVQNTFALLFLLIEQLQYYDNYVKSGQYVKSTCFTNIDRPFVEIANKTWGIIGLGNIGKSVAKIAKAFTCNVIYYSTSGKNNNSEYERVELEELLKTSDIVSIHAPLNKNTQNLIKLDELKLMKKSGVILNFGRGGIINEQDLAAALDNELIWGAAIDVFEHEPPQDNNPLMSIKNKDKIMFAPHVAWASIESRKRLMNEVYLNIKAFLNKEQRNRVD